MRSGAYRKARDPAAGETVWGSQDNALLDQGVLQLLGGNEQGHGGVHPIARDRPLRTNQQGLAKKRQ